MLIFAPCWSLYRVITLCWVSFAELKFLCTDIPGYRKWEAQGVLDGGGVCLGVRGHLGMTYLVPVSEYVWYSMIISVLGVEPGPLTRESAYYRPLHHMITKLKFSECTWALGKHDQHWKVLLLDFYTTLLGLQLIHQHVNKPVYSCNIYLT